MAKTVSDIVVTVGADATQLVAGMRRAGSAVGDFDKRADRMGVNWARVGRNVAAVTAALGAAAVAMGRQAVRAAADLENMARIANTGVEDFQKFAIAADTVRISQEKLSDILKDVTDRVGDFLATGGGPMRDFFEQIAPQVGVTAEQFARLSGREALQLYVDSLERANLSQAEMTFYMEALASDATALLPLLRNNGAELGRIGDEAQRAGRVMSQETVTAAAEMDRKFTEVSETLRQRLIVATADSADELAAFAEFAGNAFVGLVDLAAGAVARLVGWFEALQGASAESADEMISRLGNSIESTEAAIASLESQNVDLIPGGPARLQELRDRLADLNSELAAVPRGAEEARNSIEGTLLSVGGDDFAGISIGNVSDPNAANPFYTPPAIPESDDGAGGGGGGGGGRGMVYDFDALRTEFATAEELLQQEYDRRMAQLEAARQAEVDLGISYNELERRIEEDHQRQLTELQRKEQQARLQSITGALGDVASLMQSENEKIFKVGQAAALARAIIEGQEAAVSAWRHGMRDGGPALAAAYTAASLARTGALISSIRSQSASGGSSAPSAGGATTTTAEAPAPLQVSLSGITADELISGANVSALLERLSEEAGDRGFTVVGSAA